MSGAQFPVMTQTLMFRAIRARGVDLP